MATVLWRRVRGGGLWARSLSAYVALVLAVAVVGPGVTVYAADGDPADVRDTLVAEQLVTLPDEVVIDDPIPAESVAPAEEVVAPAEDPVAPMREFVSDPVASPEPKPSVEAAAATVAASTVAAVGTITAVVPGDNTNLTLTFEGVRKSSGWITGNLQTWGEGELIPYRVVIQNKDGANTVIVPAIAITMDHCVATSSSPYDFSIMYDYTTAWGYYITGTAPALGDNWYPGTSALSISSQDVPVELDDSSGTYGSAALLKTSIAEGISIPPGEYAVVYFQAHLARTPVWNAKTTPRDGAGWVQGSSGHGQLDIPGVGAKTVPTPSVPIPSGSITVYKYFDGNENDTHDVGEQMLEGWTFTLYDSLNAVVATGQTGADGSLAFTDLSLGTYTVTETLEDGWDCTGLLTRSVDVLNNTNSTVWFGNVSDRGDLIVYKYLDDNENDTLDAGEAMLAGWHFDVYDDQDVLVGHGETDLNGELTLTDLPAGTYTVIETLQAGWDSTGLLERDVVVADDGTAHIYFGNVPDRGDLTIYKYLDANENDAYDAGEEMLPGWDFSVYDDQDVLVGGGTTDAAGELAFADLPAGTYTVVETVKVGWDCTGSIERDVVVPDDGTGTVWFGNVPDEGDVTIYKYYDSNMNGLFDDAEEMLEGWHFDIYNDQDVLVGEGETDVTGALDVEGLDPGTYTAVETLQGGWTNTTPITQEFIVTDDEITTVWFGNVELGTLLVHKYLDANENGEYDEGELMLEDWEFTVSQQTPPIEPSIAAIWLVGAGYTDQNGELGFDGLTPGEYYVDEILQADWHSTTGTQQIVQVLPGQTADVWFGNAPDRGGLIVYKYYDANEDGVYDEGEELLEGWEFTVYDSEDQEVGTGTTDENGMAAFDDLLVGEYTVVETLQEGWENTSGLEEVAIVVVDETAQVYFGNIETPLPFTELDLAITKSASVHSAEAGDLVTYTLTWWNLGDTPAEDYTIVDDYDERYVTIVNANGGTVTNGKITWTFAGPLAKDDGTMSLSYTVRIDEDMPDGATNVDNVVVISHPDDADPSNNTDNERVVVTGFLPFTGGEYLLLIGLALMAASTGVALRVRAVRVK